MLLFALPVCTVPNENFIDDTQVACTDGEVVDQGELGMALDLGDVPESTDGRVVSAVLGLAGDEDWYRFTGLVLESPSPEAETDFFAQQELRLCLFLRCSDGSTASYTTCSGSEVLEDLPGCCGIRSVSLTYECASRGNVDVWIRVDGGSMCEAYDLEYRF